MSVRYLAPRHQPPQWSGTIVAEFSVAPEFRRWLDQNRLEFLTANPGQDDVAAAMYSLPPDGDAVQAVTQTVN